MGLIYNKQLAQVKESEEGENEFETGSKKLLHFFFKAILYDLGEREKVYSKYIFWGWLRCGAYKLDRTNLTS